MVGNPAPSIPPIFVGRKWMKPVSLSAISTRQKGTTLKGTAQILVRELASPLTHRTYDLTYQTPASDILRRPPRALGRLGGLRVHIIMVRIDIRVPSPGNDVNRDAQIAQKTDGITVIATDSNSWRGGDNEGPRARPTRRTNPNGKARLLQRYHTRYWDVDPVTGTKTTVSTPTRITTALMSVRVPTSGMRVSMA